MGVEAAKSRLGENHARVAGASEWDCTPDGYDPKVGERRVIYCGGCGLVLFRDGEIVKPSFLKVPR